MESEVEEAEPERSESEDRGEHRCACSSEGIVQAGEGAAGGVEGAGGGMSAEDGDSTSSCGSWDWVLYGMAGDRCEL